MNDAKQTITDRCLNLIKEVMAAHSDPDSGDYNECDKDHCAWCEEAQTILDEE